MELDYIKEISKILDTQAEYVQRFVYAFVLNLTYDLNKPDKKED